MDYTIKQLADLSGVTIRTLHYYDSISLLKPRYLTEAGYRIYGQNEIELLQQILIYKELGVELKEIKKIVTAKNFDIGMALEKHLEQLCEKREKTNRIIENVEKTIKSLKGGIEMSNKERFNGLAKKAIEENEQKYGTEIREKYGDKVIDESNARLSKLSDKEMVELKEKGEEINRKLAGLMGKDPASQEVQDVIAEHYKNMQYFWECPKEQYVCLGEMYVADERFTAYYDNYAKGLAVFMRDAMKIFGENKE